MFVYYVIPDQRYTKYWVTSVAPIAPTESEAEMEQILIESKIGCPFL